MTEFLSVGAILIFAYVAIRWLMRCERCGTMWDSESYLVFDCEKFKNLNMCRKCSESALYG